ncbi:LOW QUALITY PROTEIN: gem-associated protein 7 [Camarhynchus parvulus]|uniref:LOW QUALITY PROTEIN: gem-associated protein 7 n=1 Tax=Geospiza parvula TaxID=87175 RepID=UPI001237B123|nr:LOW QUALITY PROTEIN: gem-associated protein 7 [Camarhynchus parvulus]
MRDRGWEREPGPGIPHGRSMADPIPVPVGILRLPRGPDSSGSRGFSRHRDRDRDRDQGRDQDRDRDRDRDRRAERAGPPARELSLRLLGGRRGKRSRFCLCTGLGLRADFGAADVHCGAFQVDSLWTPLGVQASALLRSGDVLEFSFPLE